MEIRKIIRHLEKYHVPICKDSLVALHGGKDNITYKAELQDGQKVVIQYMRRLQNDKHRDFIEKVTSWVSKNHSDIGFVSTPKGISRFYVGDDFSLQIMNVVDACTMKEDNICEKNIIIMAQKLAKFHNATQDFDTELYTEINFHRDKVKDFKYQAESYFYGKGTMEMDVLIAEFQEKYDTISLDFEGVRKGIIHGDPAYKNFLINDNGEVVAWIDYDMLSVTYQLWDLADMYRAYAKMKNFTKKEANLLLQSYEEIHKLTPQEKKMLPEFIKMMALDTGYRYILAMHPESGFYNEMGNSFEKAKRCLSDYNRVFEWFGE